jgi:hypothetical protein
MTTSSVNYPAGEGLHDDSVRVDLETLRVIIPALERLETDWNDARVSIAARARGYFTPDEEDRVRQILLAYRNYRFVLYEIIHRGFGYREIADSRRQLEVFLVAFAAALTLYSKSLKLIEAYEREPLVRNKLNEPDQKFGLEADLFEEVLRGYSSPGNYRELIRGAWFWLKKRRQIQRLASAAPETWRWLFPIIRRELTIVRQRLFRVLRCRLRYDWRAFGRTVLRPVRNTRYHLRSEITTACSQIRTTRHYKPALNEAVLSELRSLIQPGDVMLVRAEEKLTSAILPGFWAHAAMFLGSATEMEEFGITAHPAVTKHLTRFHAKDKGRGCVIEALSPCVQINSLEYCLNADHVALLRPRLSAHALRDAVVEAFQYLDRPYDYEFDFNNSARVVCTGLIYRCFHKREGVQFNLVKRLGRYTLSGDDIMNQWLDSEDGPAECAPMPFDLVALALKNEKGDAEFVAPGEGRETMRRLREGWRPTRRSREDLLEPTVS